MMIMSGGRPIRVYADTSVFGGCFDAEFQEASRRFFDDVRQGRIQLLVSDTTLLELTGAPDEVRRVLVDLPPSAIEQVVLTEEVEHLRDAYLAHGIVGPASKRDAEHIAVATVADADMIVSWNFRHIVHYDKISGYQGVNLLQGYSAIRIFSPLEVIEP
jgi:hypothetical protein